VLYNLDDVHFLSQNVYIHIGSAGDVALALAWLATSNMLKK
jgi:hypothetical protein